jgi:hypothetical protein
MNTGPATDTTQFLGLEITNPSASLGLYTIVGNGNLEYGNMVKNVLTPGGTNNLPQTSLYYTGIQRPLCFNNGVHNWPVIGIPNTYNSNSNAAKDRALQNKWAECACSYYNTTGIKSEEKNVASLLVYPNPVKSELRLNGISEPCQVIIYSLDGREIVSATEFEKNTIDVSFLKPVIYFLQLISNNSTKTL